MVEILLFTILILTNVITFLVGRSLPINKVMDRRLKRLKELNDKTDSNSR